MSNLSIVDLWKLTVLQFIVLFCFYKIESHYIISRSNNDNMSTKLTLNLAGYATFYFKRVLFYSKYKSLVSCIKYQNGKHNAFLNM